MPGTFDVAAQTKSFSVGGASAAATITGPAIDTVGATGRFLLTCGVGATTGTPTSFTVDSKVQESATSGGAYTDVASGAITQLTAANTTGEVSFTPSKQFLKIVTVVAFVGGTSPTVQVGASVVAGGYASLGA